MVGKDEFTVSIRFRLLANGQWLGEAMVDGTGKIERYAETSGDIAYCYSTITEQCLDAAKRSAQALTA